MLGQQKAGVGAVERRTTPRRRVQWGCWVAGMDGRGIVKCHTRDISASGARVHLEEHVNGSAGLPSTVCFLDMRHRLAYVARIVWRQAPELGLEFLKVYRFDEIPIVELRAVIETVSQ